MRSKCRRLRVPFRVSPRGWSLERLEALWDWAVQEGDEFRVSLVRQNIFDILWYRMANGLPTPEVFRDPFWLFNVGYGVAMLPIWFRALVLNERFPASHRESWVPDLVAEGLMGGNFALRYTGHLEVVRPYSDLEE